MKDTRYGRLLMDAKDIRQTHKQYKERQQRLDISHSYDIKIANTANELHDLYEQLSRIQAEINAKNEVHKQLKDEKYREMMRQYNHEKVIKDIVNFGEKTTCSRDFIKHIKDTCSDGVNETTADLDMIEKLVSVEENIAKEIPHANLIGDLLSNLGGGVKFPSEKNEEDDVNGT